MKAWQCLAALLTLSLIVGEHSRVAVAQTAGDIEVQPIVSWQMEDGTIRSDRGGSWRLTAVDPGGSQLSELEAQEMAKHHVIFMVDTSRSMPMNHSTAGGFESVVDAVVERAQEVLRPFEQSRHIEVSLYRFDDLVEHSGRWQPTVREVARGLGVGQAIDRLPDLIPKRAEEYPGEYTYIAASVFEAVRRELELPDAPESSIPSDAPPVTVLVFTDVGGRNGGENHDASRPFDAGAYASWLDAHVGRQQLHYVHWNIRTANVEGLEPTKGVMHVRWAEPGRADGWSIRSEVDLRREFTLYSQVQLFPVIANPESSAGEVVCPAREDVNGPPVPREPILLEWQRPLEYIVGDLAGVAVGRHAISVDRRTLCDGLTRAWPNVTFVLPAHEGALAPVAWLEITDPDVIGFELLADGTEPDAPLADEPLEADRFHRWDHTEPRTYQLSAPDLPELDADVHWTLIARREGEAVDHADDLVRIRHDGESGLELTTGVNTAIQLDVPAVRQQILPFSRSVDQKPGRFAIELCARLEVKQQPRPDSVIRLHCRGCADAVLSDDRICVVPEVELESLPMSWWWIGAIMMFLVLALYVIVRLRTAPRFTGQMVGTPARGISTLTRKDRLLYYRWLWYRRPFLLHFPVERDNMEVRHGRHVGARLDTSEMAGTYIGVAPIGDMTKIWPVVVDRRVMNRQADDPAGASERSWISVEDGRNIRRLECSVDRSGRPIESKRQNNSYVIENTKLRSGTKISICLNSETKQGVMLKHCIPLVWQGGAIQRGAQRGRTRRRPKTILALLVGVIAALALLVGVIAALSSMIVM